jgi:hypothetical protein
MCSVSSAAGLPAVATQCRTWSAFSFFTSAGVTTDAMPAAGLTAEA